METFNSFYQSFKERYIYKHGQAKFNKVESIVRDSNKLADLHQKSKQAYQAPTGGDFSATIQSIGFFMFAKAETSAMGDLIAIDDWNRKVNLTNGFCSDEQLLHKAKSRLNKWQISIY